jgi:hypothetical protein
MRRSVPGVGEDANAKDANPTSFLAGNLYGIKFAWFINDQMGLRQTLFEQTGVQTFAIDRFMYSSGERDLLLQRMAVQKPDLVWIKLKGWGTGSGHKIGRKRAANMTMLAVRQVTEGRHLALEASPYSGAWSLQEYQALIRQLHVTKHAVCNYDVKVPGRDAMLDQTVQYATSFRMTDCGSCKCGRPLQEHKSLHKTNQVTAIQKNNIDEQVLRGSILRALGLDTGPLEDNGKDYDELRHGQPESSK